MSVLWQRETATVGDVVAALRQDRVVTYSTVQTILRILETKGYVTHDKVEAFERMVRPFGLVEMARTGEIAISRGRGET